MTAEFVPLSFAKLRYELLIYPFIISVKSLSISTFMSHFVYHTVDWRPISICVASDVLAMGLDHYFDHEQIRFDATKTGNSRVSALFQQAKVLYCSCAAAIVGALALSPLWTTPTVLVFFGPAFIWDLELLCLGGRRNEDEPVVVEKNPAEKSFTIKRIPWMKAVIVGIIRGCGIFAVVSSVLSSSGAASVAPSMRNASQIVLWATLSSACHMVMADLRDLEEDRMNQVPTIPVLLGSIVHLRLLLTSVHIFVLIFCFGNPYVTFASLYDLVFLWLLDENSPPWCHLVNVQSQTLTVLIYGAVEAARWYSLHQI